MLEYQCYPTWLYDANGRLLDNIYIPEIQNDPQLVSMLNTLQKTYEGLFLNNKIEFSYIGFSSDAERKKFADMVQNTYLALCNTLNEVYNVTNAVDLSKF